MADVICYSDLDEFGRELDDPLAELEQDVVHMLLESYGSNCDATTRSIGLEDALSGPENPGLRHFIQTKLTDDPRIDAAEVTITSTGDNTTRIDVAIQANESELGVSFETDGNGTVRRVAS